MMHHNQLEYRITSGLQPFLLIGMVLFFHLACRQAESEAFDASAEAALSQLGPTIHLVDTMAAMSQVLSYQIQATARVDMAREATLGFARAGRLVELQVAEGQKVKKGQVLARLDASDLKLELEQAHNALLRAQVEREDQIILHTQEGSDSLTPKQQLQVDIRSGYRQANTELEIIELKLSQTQLVAPFAGIISDVKAKPYQQITPGDPVTSLVDPRDPLLEVQVVERELAYVYLGQPAEIRFSALPDQEFSGQVKTINPRVDPSGLVAVGVSVTNPSPSIFSGMFAEVKLKDLRSPARVVVPEEAVLLRSAREVVFLYEDGLAKWRYVTTGRKSGEYVEVLSGLQAGEKVIVSGHVNLDHDTQVSVDALPGKSR